MPQGDSRPHPGTNTSNTSTQLPNDDLDHMSTGGGSDVRQDSLEKQPETTMSGSDSTEDEGDDWDNGEPLTADERANLMKLDHFSRTEQMKHRLRKRRDEEDMSWDNGEPLTAEERAALMGLSRYEREKEMNIKRNRRLLGGIKNQFSSMFQDLKDDKTKKPKAKVSLAKVADNTLEVKRVTRSSK